MGWRGALRSIAAAQRASERDAVRRQRNLERQTKQDAKLQALRQAAFEVEQYENHIERITSVHQDCGTVWNWEQIAISPPPVEPIPTNAREAAAQRKLENYVPGLFVKLFGRVEKKRAALGAAVQAARKQDADANTKARAAYEEQFADWQEMQGLAKRILQSDPNAFRDAVDELSPFRELADLGSKINFVFQSDGMVEVGFAVNGESVIPADVKSLLQSGKLSTKRMPQGRFYELYQDYVAGSVLRIARELFALLPVRTVLVTAVGHMLDTGSGHMRDQPILSVIIPRDTAAKLNFDSIDPSDALRNFVHQMDFKKSKGFGVVAPLKAEDLSKSH